MLRAATASPMRKSWKLPSGLLRISLRPAGDERLVIDLAAVERLVLELEIKLGKGQRRVLDHHLVDHALAAVGFSL